MTILEQAIASLLAVHTQLTGEHVADIVAYHSGDGYQVKVKESIFRDFNVILGDAWIQAFLRDQGISANRVGRVVVDAQMNQPLRIYVEYLGAPDALQFHPFDLTVADVVEVGKTSG